jgi:membrane associated rhomboid family serine protease
MVFHSQLRAPCDERAIVFEAVGIMYELLRVEDGYVLAVQMDDVERAAEQLRLYTDENIKRPMSTLPQKNVSNGIIGALLYVALLVIVFDLQHFRVLGHSLSALGSAHAGSIQAGEWWRTITALTLHSGISHLLGNMIFGALFGVLLSQLLGSGVAWFAILITGITGNVFSGFIKASHHSAIGASTAVFAALGILSAYTWQRRKHLSHSGFRRWAPIIAGIALLAFLGGPGERTDVLSHVTGFIAGVFLGCVFGLLSDHMKLTSRVQIVFGVATVSIVALAWIMVGIKVG